MRRLYAFLAVAFLVGAVALPSLVQAAAPQPAPGAKPAQGITVTATVKVELLNVRRAPRKTSSTLGLLVREEKVQALSRNKFSDWLEVLSRFGKGWLAAKFVSTDLNITLLPIRDVTPPFATVTTGEGAIVRLGPFDEYPVVAFMPPGAEMDVIGLHSRNTHVEVVTPWGIGWASLKAVKVEGDLTLLQQTDHLVKPRAVINTFRLRVRTAPDLEAPIIGLVGQGQQFTIIGRNYQGTWYQIQGKFGTGWLAIDGTLVKAIGYTDLIPITFGNAAASPDRLLQ